MSTTEHPSILAPPKWSKLADNVPAMSDASGWDDESNYSTIRVAVANGDLYLLARGDAGIDSGGSTRLDSRLAGLDGVGGHGGT